MDQPTPSFLSDLRQGIIVTFSTEELITLCSDLGVDYDRLAGEGKEARAHALITYLVRRDQIARLVAYCARERPRHPWPQEATCVATPSSAPNAHGANGGTSVSAAGAPQPTGAARGRGDAAARHLRQQLSELQARYEVLSKRIAALDKDLGRTLDSEAKLVLEERRRELVGERDRTADEMTRIEELLRLA